MASDSSSRICFSIDGITIVSSALSTASAFEPGPTRPKCSSKASIDFFIVAFISSTFESVTTGGALRLTGPGFTLTPVSALNASDVGSLKASYANLSAK